ncbi:MAG: NUDIX domain-containing protein [Candidatus Aenigmarchaeota archaeon]|nr:NUDIX domain-containing protein [Candidatus Aenigmarchaeota archaeon]
MKKVANAGVGVMLLKDDKVLLGKRNDDSIKADSLLHGEGTWTCPGGKLDFGEKIVDAVKKEIFEETGIKANYLNVVSVTNEIVSDAHFVTIGFLCKDFEGEPKIMEPEEIVEWKWFSLNKLPENIYPPSLKLINNYLENKIYKGD